MKMTDQERRERRDRRKAEKIAAHERHMEGVRAVHRRSAFDRAIDRLRELELWERQPGGLSDGERDQLKYVRELVQVIRKELIEHGQLEAEA